MSIIISIISILIALISLCLSIKVFYFSKIARANDKRPSFECSNSFGSYADVEKLIPSIHLELTNSGGKATVINIDEDEIGSTVVEIKFDLDREAKGSDYVDKKQLPTLLSHDEATGSFSCRKVIRCNHLLLDN